MVPARRNKATGGATRPTILFRVTMAANFPQALSESADCQTPQMIETLGQRGLLNTAGLAAINPQLRTLLSP